MYRISQITGSQDNTLGIRFAENSEWKTNLVEWEPKDGAIIKASGEQVLEQVMSGLEKANHELGKNYQLSEIHFLPSDSAANAVYELLIQLLIKHYDSGGEFSETAS